MESRVNEILDPEAEFKYKDQTGGFNTIGLRNRAVRIFNSSNRPNLRYPFYVDASSVDGNGFMPVYTENKDASFVEVWPSVVDGLESVWRWGRETASKNLAELVATKGNDGEIRIFKKDRELTTLPKTMWQKKEFNSIYGTREVAELIGSGKFDFPKPLALISQIIEIGSDSDSLILDFFSGSSTTAHATMLRNVKDGGSRRFIMVQLPELTKDGHTICEVARERINSAGKRIAQENECQRMHQREELNFGEEISAVENPDIGFRVLKLDSSSLNDTSDTPANTTQAFANFARFKEGRTSEDLLFQILLESGIPLSDPIEKKAVGGNEVFFVSGTALVACLDEKAKMTNAFFTELAQLKPTLAFFRDDAFETDAARINLEQIFAQYSPSTTLKVI